MEHWTVIGVFDHQDQAQTAIDELKQAGFGADEIGYVYRQQPVVLDKKEVEAHEESGSLAGGVIGGVLGAAEALLTPVLSPSVSSTIPQSVMPLAEEAVEHFERPNESEDVPLSEAETTKLPAVQANAEQQPEQEAAHESNDRDGVDDADVQAGPGEVPITTKDTVAGAVTGGIVGGAVGAVVALFIPVLGPALAGGILVAAFGAALGAVTGGALGAFVAMGIPEEQARHYEQELVAGRTIVTVKTVERKQDALDILSLHGASYLNAHDSL